VEARPFWLRPAPLALGSGGGDEADVEAKYQRCVDTLPFGFDE
jgi:hypothetical protein